MGTRSLLHLWKRLELKDRVLYRTIINPQEQEVRQLVLPEILKERVICSLHNDMGHQGQECTQMWKNGSSHANNVCCPRCHNRESERLWDTF